MLSQKDDAVSPVIATILLVAVVVVLVAAIAAVVLPMAGNIDSVKTVAVSVDTTGANNLPVVTIIGGPDADALSKLTVYISGATPAEVILEDNPVIGKPYLPKSGVIVPKGEHTVSVVGLFKDGTNQTLYTIKMHF